MLLRLVPLVLALGACVKPGVVREQPVRVPACHDPQLRSVCAPESSDHPQLLDTNLAGPQPRSAIRA